jgi:mRNA-degrading endonuclease RelE of RelBE toxin-antitoxin system
MGAGAVGGVSGGAGDGVTESLACGRIILRGIPVVSIDIFELAKYTQVTYIYTMRAAYMDDAAYRSLQLTLMENPVAGPVIEGTGGLRKLRHADPRRGKGKRGGLRVIYYWWSGGSQFWLFTVYDKDEARDLTAAQRAMLKHLLKTELDNRQLKSGERNET